VSSQDSTGPAGSERRRASRGWRRLLAGSPARIVLARLLDGDPLDLRGRVARGLERGALLLDAERAFLRAAARTARRAERYRGQPALSSWLDACVEEALAELVREEREAERPGPADGPEACAALAGPLGIDPRAAGRILSTFNARPLADRRAFFELVLAGRGFDALGRRAVGAARRARATLIALLEAEELARGTPG